MERTSNFRILGIGGLVALASISGFNCSRKDNESQIPLIAQTEREVILNLYLKDNDIYGKVESLSGKEIRGIDLESSRGGLFISRWSTKESPPSRTHEWCVSPGSNLFKWPADTYKFIFHYADGSAYESEQWYNFDFEKGKIEKVSAPGD